MKITVQTIMSLSQDGGSSHLLILNNDVKILLDCGLGHNFSLVKYQQRSQQLKTVSLVLISHSSVEYSGAMCFLIEEIGLHPQMFFTIQPIMRYSPLNLHEELLLLGHTHYGKKVFNKIYKHYQSIQLIKPHQKKSIDLTQHPYEPNQQENVPQPENKEQSYQIDKIINIICYSGGGTIGSVAWRINYGLINVLYLVQFNNYSLYHLNGLDMKNVLQPTDILITDTYPEQKGQILKKTHLYQQVKNIFMEFSQLCAQDLARMKPLNQRKLLITCYPNQVLVELMALMKKVLEELQPNSREQINVIHSSSRFLQLVKSQIDYFSNWFKQTVAKIDDFYTQTKTLSAKINLATVHSLDGILKDQIGEFTQVYHVGSKASWEAVISTRPEAMRNIPNMRFMTVEEREQERVSLESEEEEAQNNKSEMEVSSMHQETTIVRSEREGFDEPEPLIHGKYFSQISFPHFISHQVQEEHEFDDYGIRHHYPRDENRKTIHEYKKDEELEDLSMLKKNSTVDIEMMNIEFRVPDDPQAPFDYRRVRYLNKTIQHTNFLSSMHFICTLKPRNIILVNAVPRDPLTELYKQKIKSQLKTPVYEASRKAIWLQLPNELLAYKMNYIGIPTEQKLQKVKGTISYVKGRLQIRLNCLEERQGLEFRMQKFYEAINEGTKLKCRFVESGVLQIEGVKIYREGEKIILQGYYSDEYFKVRKLLYEFLKLR